jgi:hypothetical protein
MEDYVFKFRRTEANEKALQLKAIFKEGEQKSFLNKLLLSQLNTIKPFWCNLSH